MRELERAEFQNCIKTNKHTFSSLYAPVMPKFQIWVYPIVASLMLSCAVTVSNKLAAIQGMVSISVSKACAYLAVGEDAVWAPLVADDRAEPTVDEIARVDPRTNQIIERISLSGRYLIRDTAVGAGAVWVSTIGQPPTIHKIDPESNKVIAKIELPRVGSDGVRARVAAGDGAVWVVVTGHDEIFRLDPQTSRVVGKVRIAGKFPYHSFGGIAVGEGAVWIRHLNGVSRIDPRTNREVGMIPMQRPSTVGVNIAAGAGGVWTANNLGPIYRIDPRINQVVAEILVEPLSPGAIMAVGENTVVASPWGNRAEGAWIAVIDPKTNKVARRIPFGTDWPYSVAVGKDSIWACGFGQIWRIPLAPL